MSDRVIQEIAPLIRAYYDARGNGLQKTCEKIVQKVEEFYESADVSKTANVFKLGTTGLDVLRYYRNDRLMVLQLNRLYLYEVQTNYAYSNPSIKECKWKPIDDGFSSNAVSVEDLISNGAVVYLVRAT